MDVVQKIKHFVLYDLDDLSLMKCCNDFGVTSYVWKVSGKLFEISQNVKLFRFLKRTSAIVDGA